MRSAAVILGAALALGGCDRAPELREYSYFAFGTLVDLSLYGAGDTEGEAARRLAATRLDAWHRDWHAWRPGPLTRFNEALAAGEPVAAPEALTGILPRAYELSVRSGGLFNPAIGRLVGLWGFHADEAPAGPPPGDDAIARLVDAAPAMPDLVFGEDRVRSINPALQLDFGAFAKGYALERLADELAAKGTGDFLLNAGGDLVVRGRRGERPWRIGIRDPRGAGVLASVEAADGEAVFTSGDYERYFEWEGERYHHIIDPRTGRPARGARSVTVVTRDGALADAAATALFVAGPGKWPLTAKRMGIELAMMMTAEGEVEMTPAMSERVRFEPGREPPTRVLEP